MCGTLIEKKKDVRDGEDDGIAQVGPTIFFEYGYAIVPIWRDSLDTAFRDIWRSWPMLLHVYKVYKDGSQCEG
jgi:hypothetical protein